MKGTKAKNTRLGTEAQSFIRKNDGGVDEDI